MTTVLDALIAEAGRLGLRVNNLFQRHDRRWQANVTDDGSYWDFATGATAGEALRNALALAKTLPGKPFKRPEEDIFG